MDVFVSEQPSSLFLDFNLNFLFRARWITATFEKQAPGLSTLKD